MVTFRFSCRQFVIIAVFAAVFGLGGCAQYQWMKPGAGVQDFQRDHYHCLKESLDQAPPVYQTVDPSGGMPVREKLRSICSEQARITDCSVKRQQDYGSLPYTTDLNEPTRAALYSACLNAEGWQQVRVNNE